jgi:hypothetical protein
MTAIIDDFAAIRGASASPRLGSNAGIRTLFRKWLGHTGADVKAARTPLAWRW